jgi:hypothetical protein
MTMKSRTQRTPEQIAQKLPDAMLNVGKPSAAVLQRLEISAAIYHHWCMQCGSMKASEAKRLKTTEKENKKS